MTIIFVSNYINHHQIPFSEACYRELGEGYRFIQTEPMEEERVAMGWGDGGLQASLCAPSVRRGRGMPQADSGK